MKKIIKKAFVIGCMAGLLLISSCEKSLRIDPPRTDLVKSTVFTNDATANAAVLDIYYQMNYSGFASGSFASFSLLGSLSSDELVNYITYDLVYQRFNDNHLIPTDGFISSMWSESYQLIYKANAVLEGLSISAGLSEELKSQLNGEAKFIRAFCHFYLANLWGDVPLVLTTDYKTNANIPRTSIAKVYEQIINDLKDAQSLLSENYSFSNSEKVRANKGVATALLARVYLYTEDWNNAEAQATSVINNATQYDLTDLNSVFLANSTEAIWQLSSDLQNTNDAVSFTINSTPPSAVALSQTLVDAFEPGDQRRIDWIGSVSDGINDFYYPFKYKTQGPPPITEYSMVLRLAEQYLIRAEARAHLGDITGSQADINAIRSRANLGGTPANDKSSLLTAIERERKVELFTEWGHRWLDLKRTGRANAVLGPIKPDWVSTAVLYPIPEVQILNDPSMRGAQNPGY